MFDVQCFSNYVISRAGFIKLITQFLGKAEKDEVDVKNSELKDLSKFSKYEQVDVNSDEAYGRGILCMEFSTCKSELRLPTLRAHAMLGYPFGGKFTLKNESLAEKPNFYLETRELISSELWRNYKKKDLKMTYLIGGVWETESVYRFKEKKVESMWERGVEIILFYDSTNPYHVAFIEQYVHNNS